MSDIASAALPRPPLDGVSAAAAPSTIREGAAAAAPNTAAFESDGVKMGGGRNEVVLSLRDDRYRTLMWGQFRLLGQTKDYDRDERVGRELFDKFKEEGVATFYKLPKLGRQRTRVEDGEALEIITTHLKRRSESAHRWRKARKVASAPSPERDAGAAPMHVGEGSTLDVEGPAAMSQLPDAKPAASKRPPLDAAQESSEDKGLGSSEVKLDAERSSGLRVPPIVHRPMSIGTSTAVGSEEEADQPSAEVGKPAAEGQASADASTAAEQAPIVNADPSTQVAIVPSRRRPPPDAASESLPQDTTVQVPAGAAASCQTSAAAAVQPGHDDNRDDNRALHTEEKKQEDQDVPPSAADAGSSSVVTHDGPEAVPTAESKDQNGPEGAAGPKKEEVPPTGDIILSLNDDYYREVMWKHYRVLGKARDSDRETEFADIIFTLFKNHLGSEGRFFKTEGHASLHQHVEVDDEMAHAKIIADIRRRMKNYRTWSTSPEKQPASRSRTRRRPSTNSPPISQMSSPSPSKSERQQMASASAAKSSPPKGTTRRSPRKPASASNVFAGTTKLEPPAEGDVTLSMDDDLYRDVMWTQYNILGRKGAGDNSREVVVGKQLLALFKGCLGEGSKFMKRDKRGGVPSRVDDHGALLKITRDLKRRNETMQKWHGYKSKYHMTVPANADVLDEDSPDDDALEVEEDVLDGDLLQDDPLDFLEPSLTEDYAWRDQLAPSPIEAIDEKLPPSAQPNKQQISEPKPKKSAVELLSASHLGQRMPPLKTIPFVKSVHTANQLVYALQHATHKLNELNFGNGPRSKHAKLLRLYHLPELNEEYTGGASKPPILNQLAESMETTPKSLRKWFTMYRNAVERGFDFETFGKDKIKVHHGIFFGERYQLTFGGERALEEYFQEAGGIIVGDAENSPSSMPDYNIFAGPPGISADPWSGLDFDALDVDANAMSVDQLHPSPLEEDAAKNEEVTNVEDVAIEESPSEEDPKRDKNPFNRHYQKNEARLLEMKLRVKKGERFPSDLLAMKLNPVAKRVSRGTKHRMLCMVEGCEKHSQTKGDGCCLKCFRLLDTIKIKQIQEGHSWHVAMPPGILGKRKAEEVEVEPQPAIPKADISLDQLVKGSRIYIEWEADHGLYKATVKRTFTDKGDPMVQLHYDGKKRHIFDTIPFGWVHSFIEGENVGTKAVAEQTPANNKREEEECQEVAAINQAHLAPQASGAYDLGKNRRNFASLCSEPKSSTSQQRDPTSAEMRSFVTISPVTVGQFGRGMGNHAASLSPSSSSAPSNMKVPGVGSISVGKSSAFSSPSTPARPTLHHQLYHSPGQQFPDIKRPASATRVQKSAGRARTFLDRGGDRKVDGKSRPKRKHTPTTRFEVEDSSQPRPAESDGPTKSILCHCPDCGKRDLSVQGIYAHYGRAHSAKVDWPSVTFSCPFCTARAAGRVFKSIRDVEMHAIAAHPGCIVQGPHPSKVSGQPKRAKISSSIQRHGVSPKSNRALRDRKSLLPVLEEEYEEPVVEEQGPPRWDKLEYARLLPDGRKDYPSELFRVVGMVDEQCQRQEKEVEVAREQRVKLCAKEAEMEARALDEERLSYQRGIRERTSLADQERLEKLRYAERADEMIMRYEHEGGDNKKRQQEDAEVYKLCSRPIHFSKEAGKQNARQMKACTDDQCQFCKKDKGCLHHLLLDSEMSDFDVGAPTTKSPLFKRDTKVLNPSFSIIGDEHFLDDEESDTNEDANEASSGSKRVNPSRRDASTAKRLKTEEERLWMLRNTKHSLEFIQKYNEGLISNAWGEVKKDSRGRRVY